MKDLATLQTRHIWLERIAKRWQLVRSDEKVELVMPDHPDSVCPQPYFKIGWDFDICPSTHGNDGWVVTRYDSTPGTYMDPPETVDTEIFSGGFFECVKALLSSVVDQECRDAEESEECFEAAQGSDNAEYTSF